MGTHHLIALRQMRADSDRHRLLADAQVHGAAHLLFGIALGDPAFDHADAQHLLEQTPQGFRVPFLFGGNCFSWSAG